jgi:hypothetical protein
MTRVWPGSVIELLGSIGPLTDPTRSAEAPTKPSISCCPRFPGTGSPASRSRSAGTSAAPRAPGPRSFADSATRATSPRAATWVPASPRRWRRWRHDQASTALRREQPSEATPRRTPGLTNAAAAVPTRYERPRLHASSYGGRAASESHLVAIVTNANAFPDRHLSIRAVPSGSVKISGSVTMPDVICGHSSVSFPVAYLAGPAGGALTLLIGDGEHERVGMIVVPPPHSPGFVVGKDSLKRAVFGGAVALFLAAFWSLTRRARARFRGVR